MWNYINKKMKIAKMFRICLVTVFILWILSFVLLSVSGTDIKVIIIPFTILTSSIWIGALVYWISFHPVSKSIKWFNKKGESYFIDDISLAVPTLPKSKIYCGSQVMFSKKPCTIIPYSEISWVYVSVKQLYGIVTVRKDLNIICKDGERFVLSADMNEFKWLLTNYIVKFSPDVIIGYGQAQKQIFNQRKQI